MDMHKAELNQLVQKYGGWNYFQNMQLSRKNYESKIAEDRVLDQKGQLKQELIRVI